jgi:uncharacterized membrane protein
MEKRLLRNMVIVGASALALAASTIVLPSVADAAGQRPGGGHGHAMSHGGSGGGGAHFGGHGGRGGYGGGGYGGGGYVGGYYGGYCGPIQITLGLCGPYGY